MDTRTSSFDSDLSFEKEKMSVADQWYLRRGANNIRRNAYEERPEEQKKDIDLELELEGRIWKVSEKFSRKETGTFIIELTSGKKEGWSLTSQSHMVCSFSPDKVRAILTKDIRNLAQQIYTKYKDVIENLQKGRLEFFRIYRDGAQITLRVNSSSSKTSTWNSVFATISYRDLQKLGIRVFEEKL